MPPLTTDASRKNVPQLLRKTKTSAQCRTCLPSGYDNNLARPGSQTQPTDQPVRPFHPGPTISQHAPWARPFEPIFNTIPTPAVMTRHRKYDSKEIANAWRPHEHRHPVTLVRPPDTVSRPSSFPIVVPRTVSRGIKQDGKSEARHKGNRKTRAME